MEKLSFSIMAILAVIGFILFMGVGYWVFSGKSKEEPKDPDITDIVGYYGGKSFRSCGLLYYNGPTLELTSTPQEYRFPFGAHYSFWYDGEFEFDIQNFKNGPKIISSNIYRIPNDVIWLSYSGPGIKFVKFGHTWQSSFKKQKK